MEKFYIFRKLAQEVKQFAAIALIVLLAVGNAFAEYDGTGTFTKINSADELTTGYYVVTNQTGEFALKNEAASNYIYRSNAEFVNPSSDIVWYVNVAADGSITLFNEEAGVYVEYHGNATSGSNYAYLVTELSDNCRWTPTLMDAGWDLANAVKNFRHLSYNPSNNGLRFACYANMNQQRLAFYKRGEAETPVVEAPVFTPGTGTYYTEQMVSLSCATTGANVYYAINGGDLILYNAPFTINANAHVSACAIIGEDTSAVTTVNYTFPVFINNIAAYYAAENADLFKITGDLTFVYRNGRYVYVKDETGGLLVYDNASVITTEYNEGDVFAGGLVGTRSMYHGLDEFEPVLNTAEGISGDEVAPVVVSAAQLLANPQNYVSQLVMVVGGEFAAGSFNTNTATKINFTQEGSTIKVRNAFKTVSRTFDAGDVATVIGFVTIYDNEVQLFPRDNADIITTALPVSCNFADNSTMLWTLVNGESASKWHIGAPQGFDDNKLYISSSNGLTNKYNVSVACDVHAYMDVTLPASDVLLTFDVRSMGDANDFLQVSVMDESPEAGSLPTEYLARFYGVDEFTTQTILIPASYAGDKKLVFTWHNDASGGTQAPAVIDNVVLKNTCAMVSNIEAEVEGSSATITWDAPEGQNSWTLQYRIVGAEDWQTVNASTAAVTLDNLTTDIVYDVRVRSNCGESASYWATYQFAVPCINWSTAQEEIAIGTGTSSSYLSPFNNYYRNSATQMMYPADQFPTAGYINSISWEMVGNSSHNYSDLKIYLGTSSSYTNSAWMPEENMTLVYHETDGTLGGGSAGWVEFPLDNPYYYNGEGNLVILVTRAASSYNSSLTYRYTTVSNSVRYRRDDNNASFADYPAMDAANSNTSTYLPNIKLDFTGFVCDDALCKAPKNLTAEVHAHTVNVSWLPVEGVSNYEVHVSGGDNMDFTLNVQNASQTNITGLVEGAQYTIGVKAVCGEGNASKYTTVDFTMPTICPAPTGLAVQEVGENSATITWNAGDASAWTVECGPAGFTLGEGTQIVVNENAITLTGLNVYSSYDVYVKADCGLGYESDWSSKLSFTTECGFITITEDNPWVEDFESHSGSGNLAFDDCWATPELTSFNSPFIYRNYTPASHSGKNSAELKGNSGAVATLVLPDFTNPLSDLQFSYYGRVTGTTPGTMQLGYIIDPNDASSFVEVMQIPAQSGSFNRANAMLYGPFTFGNDVPAGARITLRFTSATNNCSWNLDDFTVELRELCNTPYDIAADNITSTQAELSWNAAEGQSAWNIQCGVQGFQLGEGTVLNVTTNPYTLTGLTSATSYDVYVQADCGADGVSNWFGPYTFTTAIDCEQFCNYTLELSDSYGDGWDEARVTVTYNNESTTYTIDDGEFESFPIQICDQTSAVFAYSIGSYASENSLELKDANGNVVWSHGGVNGNASQIITANCGTPVVEDCVLPENLAVTEYTSTSATLTWDGDAATQYEVSYYTATNDWVVSTVTGTTITLTGLSENQVYFARVRALCDETNTYSNEVNFFTTNAGSACDDHTVSSQSGSNYYTPVNSYYKYSHSEQIYTPDEVGGAGNITKISFNYAHTSAMTKKNNVTISLGHTTKSSLSSSDSWTTTGLTQVYQGSLNCSNGWNEFVLDTEFPYNGTDNLVVVVNDMSNGYDGSAYKFYYTNTSSNMCLTYQNDSYAWSSSSVKTARSYRPDIRFNVCTAATDIALLAVQDMTNACDLSNTTVAVNVKNTGSSNVTAFKLYYNVNGGAVVQENVALSEPLEPGNAMTCTFSQHANMTDASNIVKAWVEMVGDGNNNNNVVFSNPVEVIEPASIPFTETFAAAEMHDGWSMVAPNNAPSFVIANNALRYNAGDESAAEAVATSPCLDMSDDEYILTYDYKANSSYYNEQFSMFLTPSADANEDNVRPIVTKVFNNTEYVHAVERVSFWPWMDYNYDVNYLNIKAESGVGTEGFTIDNIHFVKALPLGIFTPDQHGTVQILTDNILNLYIDASASTYLIPENEDITLAISAQPGYHVQGIYSGELDDMVLLRGENPDNAALDFFTFTGGQHTVITVLFAPNNYNVDATVNNLYVTPYNNNAPGATYAPNHEVVAHGGNHTGVITIADHYSLESVAVNGMDVTSDLVALGENQYRLTLTNIWEDKDIQAVTVLDSAAITYTVLGGQGTINGTYVVDAATELPATYTVTLPAYADLLSTIAPAPGFHVASIVIDGVEHTNISAYSFERLLGNHTVEVMFARNNYTITTVGYGNGTVSEGVAFLYNPDYTYTFEATPDAGYRIGSITRNNVALTVDNPAVGYTETLTNIVDNYDYEVMFVQNTYAITATAGNNGTVSPAGTSYYNYHQNADYDIVAALGYYIASVTVDGVTSSYTQTDNMTSTTYTFNAVDADHSISATFAPKVYTVTVDAGNHGAITPSTASYAFGSMPTFTIIPDAGYVIMDVMVDGVSLGSVATYTFPALTADHTIAATFGASQYTITATAGNGGSITPDGVTSMAYNGTQAYTISANAGYHVSNVFVDGASVGAVTSYTFANVTADHTIYAAFEANEYTVTVNQPANGTITPGTMAVQYGATPAFVITPDAGYNVTAITVNGSNVMSSATQENGIYTYTFPAINANQTINATMTAKTYTINASAGANGSITPSGSTTVNFGATQLYTIVPSAGYVVDNVTVDGIAMGALTSYVFTNVTASHTISATFKMAECEVPAFMYTSHIDSVSAMLHWSHPTATSFDIQYKTLTGSLANVSNVTGNSYQLTDLNPSTTYLWQVRANCTGSNHSDWSNLVAFTTEATLDITGVEDLVKDEIKVYGEHQNVHILNNGGVNIDNVRIFDAYGRMVYSGSVGTSHEVINLNVATGAYVVSVVTDKGVANYKVTIMK